jgi:hypothetical protein
VKISIWGYYSDADEADLLIDQDQMPESYAEEIASGVYLYRERDSGHVVGVFIRGYEEFLRKVRDRQAIIANRSEDQPWIDAVIDYHQSLLTAVYDPELISALRRAAEVASELGPFRRRKR